MIAIPWNDRSLRRALIPPCWSHNTLSSSSPLTCCGEDGHLGGGGLEPNKTGRDFRGNSILREKARWTYCASYSSFGERRVREAVAIRMKDWAYKYTRKSPRNTGVVSGALDGQHFPYPQLKSQSIPKYREPRALGWRYDALRIWKVSNTLDGGGEIKTLKIHLKKRQYAHRFNSWQWRQQIERTNNEECRKRADQSTVT